MSHLISFAYKSDAQDGVSEQTLIDILTVSRKNNTNAGITGMLLFARGKYFQVLEGEADVVHALFNDKIRKDPRHTNVELLAEKEIDEREFPTWAMGFYWEDSVTQDEFAMLNAGNQSFEIMRRIKEHMADNKVEMPL